MEDNKEKNEYIELFEDDKSFQELAKVYFNKNFGTLSKSEIDLLMFKILYRKLEDKKKNKSKESNANKGSDNDKDCSLSDFTIARNLGITKQRVKSLKERMQLKYPKNDNEDWRAKVNDILESGVFEYDANTMEFRALIDDAMLRYDIEEFLETENLIMDYSMNSKVVTIKRIAFLALIYKCSDADQQKKIDDALKQARDKNKKDIEEQTRKKTVWAQLVKELAPEVLKGVIGIGIEALVPSLKGIFKVKKDNA